MKRKIMLESGAKLYIGRKYFCQALNITRKLLEVNETELYVRVTDQYEGEVLMNPNVLINNYVEV